MSADTRPISPSRFAAALKDLSVGMLHLKVLEIRNSIAHLQFSNDQLEPFAKGTATALSDAPAHTDATASSETATNVPDQDCIDAIRENELVIERMAERIALIRVEVEDRGQSWDEFQSQEEVEAATAAAQQQPDAHRTVAPNGQANGNGTADATHSAWGDGTFQTGSIRGGEVHMDSQAGRPSGGTLSDEQLRAALEERMRNMGTEDDDDGGMHL